MANEIEGKSRFAKRVSLIGAVLLLGAFFGYQLFLASADSQTTDEAVHLSAGLTYLRTNDYRYNPEHPPLVKKLAALPLIFTYINEPSDAKLLWDKGENFFYDSWKENRLYGDELMYQTGNNADRLIFLARIGPILLALLLGIAIYGFSVYFWGYWGGLLSLGLFVLDPTVNAHSHLVTTDIGASLGFLLTIGTFYIFLRNNSWRNAIFFGLALGFALLCKFTLIIAIPIVIIFYLAHLFTNRADAKNTFKKTFVKIMVACLIVWAVIWIGYGFSYHLAPPSESIVTSMKIANEKLTDVTVATKNLGDKIYSAARCLLIPRDFFKGLALVLGHVENGHSSFFLGQLSNQGWWYYFPVLFLLKTPLPSLLLFALAAYAALKNRTTKDAGIYLLAGSLLFLIFAMQSKANLGLRHVLPMYPLLFILAGSLLYQANKKRVIVTTLLVILLIIEFVRIQPFNLGYYNQLAGGSRNGYKIATDSNLDWGQDIERIRDYTQKNKLTDVTVVYYWDGAEALEYYGIKTRTADDFLANKSGTLIIGASVLASDQYKFLKDRAIDDYISPGTLVYRFN